MLSAIGACLAAFLASLLLAANVNAADRALDVTEVAQGVFVHQGRVEEFSAENRGDIANIGFVVGERCVAVIDSGTTLSLGRALLTAVRQRTALPVCYVINTHMHLDHVFGNGAFESDRTIFVAAANMPAALGARAEGYLRALEEELGGGLAGTRAVYPTRLVEDEMRLDLGGRQLLLRAWPTAHTNNDLTVYDEATSTLWVGDLLFDQHLPIVDGSILGWLRVMDSLSALPALKVVPGHGSLELVWPEALKAQRSYLMGVTESVRNALRRGRTLREVLDGDSGSPPPGWKLAERFHSRNLSAAYTELEWE